MVSKNHAVGLIESHPSLLPLFINTGDIASIFTFSKDIKEENKCKCRTNERMNESMDWGVFHHILATMVVQSSVETEAGRRSIKGFQYRVYTACARSNFSFLQLRIRCDSYLYLAQRRWYELIQTRNFDSVFGGNSSLDTKKIAHGDRHCVD